MIKVACPHSLDIDPQAFAAIMQRIVDKKSDKDQKSEKNGKTKSVLDYFASHPNTQQRNTIAQKYSACFKQKTFEQCN